MKKYAVIKKILISIAVGHILIFISTNIIIEKSIKIIEQKYQKKAYDSKVSTYLPEEIKTIRNEIDALAGRARGGNYLIFELAISATGYCILVFWEKRNCDAKNNKHRL